MCSPSSDVKNEEKKVSFLQLVSFLISIYFSLTLVLILPPPGLSPECYTSFDPYQRKKCLYFWKIHVENEEKGRNFH